MASHQPLVGDIGLDYMVCCMQAMVIVRECSHRFKLAFRRVVCGWVLFMGSVCCMWVASLLFAAGVSGGGVVVCGPRSWAAHIVCAG